MTSADRHRRVEELLPAYALGVADPEERLEVEVHLEECSACRADLQAWRRTASAVASSPEPVAPGARVRKELLRTIGEPEPAAPPAPSRRPPFRHAAAIAVAALALAALVTALTVQNRMRGELAATRGRVAELENRLAETDRQLRSANTELGRARAVLDLVAASSPDRDVVLAGLEAAPGSHGRVVIDTRGGRALLVADGLPKLPANRVYQLWRIEAGTPVSAGLFEAQPGGTATLLLENVTQLPDAWAVTEEPAGGVPKPTGPMVLLG